MRRNAVRDKSFAFSVCVVRLSKQLQVESREFVLSRQLLRSGTAIGALVREAEQAESKADFVHKLAIALKEANETQYWLELLQATDQLREPEYSMASQHVSELLKLLTSIIKKTKSNL